MCSQIGKKQAGITCTILLLFYDQSVVELEKPTRVLNNQHIIHVILSLVIKDLVYETKARLFFQGQAHGQDLCEVSSRILEAKEGLEDNKTGNTKSNHYRIVLYHIHTSNIFC